MLRFALLGCGRISQKHVDAIASIEGAELVAVCDIRPDRAVALARGTPGCRPYNDLREMLASERLDVVNVLTPSGLHAEHAIVVARNGRHVVVEKPMALRLDDADRMLEACDEAGVKLFVVKQNRYNQAVRQLRRAFEEGRFGRIVMGTVRVRWCRRQEYYDLDAWRGTWALDGGVLANQASHHIDLLQWMLGPVGSVFARTGRFLARIEAEDTGVAILNFRSGAIGVVEATTCTRPRDLEGSLSILGERGAVEIGGFAVNEVRAWQFEDEEPEDEAIRRGGCKERPPNVYGFGHRAYLQNVVDSLNARGSALVDGLEGRKSLELIHAIYESGETGTQVPVPCMQRASRLGGGGSVE